MRLVLLALGLAGCGVYGFAPATGEGPGPIDAVALGGDAEPGVGGRWRETTPLPVGRGLTCAVSLEDRVYVIGGGTSLGLSTPLDDVWVGEVSADGTIAVWLPARPLPGPVRWHACAVDDRSRTLYVIGGDAGVMGRTTVWRSAVDSGGGLGPWGADVVLPAPRRGLVAFVAEGFLHAVGGEEADGFLVERTVYRSDISSLGTLSPWMEAPSLPVANYLLGAATIGDQVYLTGGWGAPTGTLAGMTSAGLGAATPLPGPHQHHASVALGGHVYVLAGQVSDEGTAVATIRRAPVSPGAIGAWQTLAPLPRVLTWHAATVAAGRIYVVGGRDLGGAALTTVFVYDPPP